MWGGIKYIWFRIETISAIGTVLLACSIFLLTLQINLYLSDENSIIYVILRKMSMVIYFIHMYIWMGWYIIIYQKKTYGIRAFIATVTISIIISFVYVVYKYKNDFHKLSR